MNEIERKIKRERERERERERKRKKENIFFLPLLSLFFKQALSKSKQAAKRLNLSRKCTTYKRLFLGALFCS